MSKINCFIPFSDTRVWEETLSELNACDLINRVYLLGPVDPGIGCNGCSYLKTDGQFSTDTIKKIANHSTGIAYSMIITGESGINLGTLALERFISVITAMEAGMVYSDYFDSKEGKLSPHPVIDYQAGSLRDDFEFGPVLFFRSQSLIDAARDMGESFNFAGLYQLRLKISQQMLPVRIPEMLYSVIPIDTRASAKKMFDYVDPKNRSVQVEMEQAVTTHLKELGGYLEPVFEEIRLDTGDFEVEASVIIPVRDRKKTISDAIESVMSQHTSFDLNLIIVDNHSTDGTTEIIRKYAAEHENLVHVIPDRYDLWIGGCWNLGAHHPRCGKFAIQLDSDDVYGDDHTLQKIVDAFYDQQCVMVIGSYRMTNLN